MRCSVHKRSDDAIFCVSKYHLDVELLGDVKAFFGGEYPGSGRYRLNIPKSIISDDNDVDLDDKVITSQIKTRRLPSTRGAKTQYTGKYKLLVVRVTDSARINDSVRLSAEEIGDNVFGVDGDDSGKATLLERMDSCSKGLFTFERMTGSALVKGVLDVVSTKGLENNSNKCKDEGESLADLAIKAGRIDSDYDYIMVMCPPSVNFGSVSSK